LQVVDTLTGNSLWSVNVTAQSSKSTPSTVEDATYYNVMNSYAVAIGEGIVLVTGGDGSVTAYDLSTHDERWSLTTDGNSVTTPVVADGSVFLSSPLYNANGESRDDPNAAAWVYRIDATSGEVTWKQETDPYAPITGLLGDDALLLNNRTILSTVDGSVLGEMPGDDNDYQGSWTFGKDAIYSVDNKGNLIAWTYNPATHTLSENWQAYLAIQPYEASSGLAIVGDRLIARGPNSTLIALSADGTMPDSAEASGTPSALDFSGLTPCSPPPSIDYLNVTGEPANTLQTTSAVLGDDPVASGVNPEYVEGATQTEMGDWTVTIVDDPTRQPWFSTDEVPTGTAASEDVIAGIESTLQAIKDCDHPGITTDASGFYSEDFYRRSWVQAQIEQLAQSDPIGSLAGTAGVYYLNEIQSVTVLPDGRVAVLGQPGFNVEPDDFAMFVVFVQQGDTWVIDESIRVGLNALMG
jgi:outer membrane protein assembly factor BamB